MLDLVTVRYFVTLGSSEHGSNDSTGEELTVYEHSDEPARPRREREIVSPWKIMKII